jgi:hypothetical protein
VNIDAAYELYGQGDRDGAMKVINEILEKVPNHLQARALRDRIDTEELQQFNQKTRNLQEAGDENVATVYIALAMSIAFAILGTVLAIPALNKAFSAGGFTREVVTESAVGKSTAPAHVLLIYPVVCYLLAAASFYGYRRYRN